MGMETWTSRTTEKLEFLTIHLRDWRYLTYGVITQSTPSDCAITANHGPSGAVGGHAL